MREKIEQTKKSAKLDILLACRLGRHQLIVIEDLGLVCEMKRGDQMVYSVDDTTLA